MKVLNSAENTLGWRRVAAGSCLTRSCSTTSQSGEVERRGLSPAASNRGRSHAQAWPRSEGRVCSWLPAMAGRETKMGALCVAIHLPSSEPSWAHEPTGLRLLTTGVTSPSCPRRLTFTRTDRHNFISWRRVAAGPVLSCRGRPCDAEASEGVERSLREDVSALGRRRPPLGERSPQGRREPETTRAERHAAFSRLVMRFTASSRRRRLTFNLVGAFCLLGRPRDSTRRKQRLSSDAIKFRNFGSNPTARLSDMKPKRLDVLS
jgi:hypothetical protein